MIGAGSVVFCRNLTGDILSYPLFKDATFAYHDIDAERLQVGASGLMSQSRRRSRRQAENRMHARSPHRAQQG